MLNQEQLVRNISVMANGEVDFFLGAGASIASGIPTGGDLIWQFKRFLYCMDHRNRSRAVAKSNPKRQKTHRSWCV